MKKVLLVIIDALASRVVVPAIESGKLPHFKQLAEVGILIPDCTPIFPSITPAATSAIATGSYPQEHGIPGDFWYNEELNRVEYFGGDFWVIINRGIGTFFQDFLLRLNDERLQARTIQQYVERSGYEAAVLNFMIFHGDKAHDVHVPWLLKLFGKIDYTPTIQGPTYLYVGDFASSPLKTTADDPDSAGGPFHRFGFDDQSTGDLLMAMAENRAFPEFTLAYFPDNDFESHKVGPPNALPVLQKVDDYLGKLFDHYNGLNFFLDDFSIFITGDHSQCDIVDDRDTAAIRLGELLDEFSLVPAGEEWSEGEQVMVCPNLRAAQLYVNKHTHDGIFAVIGKLFTDERIDQVIWEQSLVDPEGRGAVIATSPDTMLHFWQGDDGADTAVDQYGCAWSWVGDLAVVDGQVSEDGVLSFPTYPNAFERIVGVLNWGQAANLWVTATPGHEFVVERIELNPGGSHGSLHLLDSQVPLIIAGMPDDLAIPENPRTVDVLPMCLSVLNVRAPREAGVSHMQMSD